MAVGAKGYNLSNFVLELGGKAAGYLSTFKAPDMEVEKISQALGPDGVTKAMHGGPKLSAAKAVHNISQTGEMLDWVKAVWAKNCQEKDSAVLLADMNYDVKRRIDMMRCLINKVTLSPLDAKDNKKAFDVTVEWDCEAVKYGEGGGKLQAELGQKAKNWLTCNYEPMMPSGIDGKTVTKLELPAMTVKIAAEHHGASRWPTRHYASWELSGLKSEHSSYNMKPVQDLCVKVLQDGVIEEKEYESVIVNMLDQSMKKTLGTFTMIGCAPLKFVWADELKVGDTMAQCKVDWTTEEITLDLVHK